MRHRLVKSAAAVLLLIIIVTVVGALLAWNADLLRSSFIRFVSWQSGRAIDVRGTLHLHLLTRSPRIEAEQVTIGNPPWTTPGITAEIAKLTVTFAPLLSHQSGLSFLKIDTARLHFMRDGAGHANWQRVDPDKSPGAPLPMIRALELAHAHVTLTDERLHLAYDGDLSVVGPDSAQPLQMEGSGTLNERAVTFRLKGDALPSAAPDKPYAFEFDERSSGTDITAHGSLPQPFDLGRVDAEFDASGADMRDLYYLVGVTLPNTGTFHLQGRMVRRGNETLFDDLKVVSGQSDVQGRVSLDTQKSGRTLVHAELSSALLRLADVGLRAAGRDPHPGAPPKLFSDVQLITPAARRVDATGKYSARRLLLSRVEVSELSAPFSIERGLVKAPEVTGHFMGGTFVLHLDTDANQTPARTRIEMTLTGLQLAQVPHKAGPPPYEGSLLLQLQVQGRGDSLHALAAGADGSLSARVLQGTIRASLAELAGVDLRGLGLTLTGNSREVPVHCAAADFEIHSGVMHPTRFFIDSERVFISGEGRVLLDPETLDLKLHGEPKGLRILRLKAPVLVQGTLLQPKFSVDVANSGLQLVDRGTPRNADCAALQLH
ncbi:MAG: AsmA family protein [Steroidobacteraceae bacterium]